MENSNSNDSLINSRWYNEIHKSLFIHAFTDHYQERSKIVKQKSLRGPMVNCYERNHQGVDNVGSQSDWKRPPWLRVKDTLTPTWWVQVSHLWRVTDLTTIGRVYEEINIDVDIIVVVIILIIIKIINYVIVILLALNDLLVIEQRF